MGDKSLIIIIGIIIAAFTAVYYYFIALPQQPAGSINTNQTSTSQTSEDKIIDVNVVANQPAVVFEIPAGKTGVNIQYRYNDGKGKINNQLGCQIFSLTENKEYCQAPLPAGNYALQITGTEGATGSLVIELNY